jgi:hypothetical protein
VPSSSNNEFAISWRIARFRLLGEYSGKYAAAASGRRQSLKKHNIGNATGLAEIAACVKKFSKTGSGPFQNTWSARARRTRTDLCLRSSTDFPVRSVMWP